MNSTENYRITNKIVNIAIITISLMLLFYTGYRATVLSFTFDESLSFNYYVPLKFMEIISYSLPSSGNHMLNTLSMKFISNFIGSSEFLLRLPSLLSHVCYIIFTYLICKKISTPVIALAGFIILNTNPCMLEFFSLARGYSMAIAFTVVSIYFLFLYSENNKLRNLILTLVFAGMAVLSSFTLLIYYVSLLMIINLYWIFSQNSFNIKEIINKNKPLLITTFFLVVIIFEPIRKLIKYDQFLDGGTTSFWSDTVGSLISYSFFGQPYVDRISMYIEYFTAIGFLSMVIYFIYSFFLNKKQFFSNRFTIAFLLLILPIIVSISQHYILKSNYLINRMALFFIPLFFLPLIILINNLATSTLKKIIGSTVLFIIAGAFSFHTIKSYNTSYTLNWRFDADIKTMLSDLEVQKRIDNKTSVKLGIVWLFEPTVNFYRTTKKYDWLEKVADNNNFRNSYYDYYFLADSNLEYINNTKKNVIKNYTISSTFLAK
ncbi:MAG: ArnT family glycosyltransferase [Tenuifilaceae bacterium]